MWYKCLNLNCGFVFPATEECNKCPDCGKQDLREATDEEIASVSMGNINENSIKRKPSLDERIKNADKRRDAQDIPPNSSNQDGGNQRDKGTPGYESTQQEPEL